MTIPRATYRLQFHRNFKFADAERHIKYFADLGISHIYTSPILTARAGSMHGYDVVDHGAINPELGGEVGFRRLAKALRQHDIGIIVDIVPNHMAVGQADNSWWLDLLAKGPGSAYAGAFDIDWDTPGLEGKVLAPFLNGSPDALLAGGELALIFDPNLKRHCFAYYGHRFPLRPEDQQHTDTDVHAVLGRQHFVLADWREADQRINWRRFFDVTELAAIRVAQPEIFEAVHRKIFALYGEGLIDGIRIDHVDGIADPGAYCRQLRKRLEALRPGAWIVVEKILADGESLPGDWLVDGTTGYDFMNEVSALMHAEDNGVLSDAWQMRSGRSSDFESEEIAARREILGRKFPAQLRATARAFVKCLPGATFEEILSMLAALLEKLRCYRSYVSGPSEAPSTDCLSKILRENRSAFGPLVDVFGRIDGDGDVEDAIRRFAQLSAPLAAKAVEDTAFYRYGRLLSRNDVGFDPRRHTLDIAAFHQRMARRSAQWPHSMLATATHDHKRGEDTRARFAVLSEVPEKWVAFIDTAPQVQGLDTADLYFLYQTLFGAWPCDLAGEPFVTRIQDWCRKYLREAKLRSSWEAPNISYEKRFCDHARGLILGSEGTVFRQGMLGLLVELHPAIESKVLIQTMLRNTVPGVPDLYQGCEWEDLSMVDPDNRRPVDFEGRSASLFLGKARKQRLIASILRARCMDPNLWEMGSYRGLPVGENCLAFTRCYENRFLIAVAALRDILVPLREEKIELTHPVRDLVTDTYFEKGEYPVRKLLGGEPIGVLVGKSA